ncbi:MAG: alpha-L-rhamnosidase [Ruminococcaceae bacterium]|nr:alpha-L-rhamnosidase [Oscillospiraceae bacterium]
MKSTTQFITAPAGIRTVPEAVDIPAFGRPIYFRHAFLVDTPQEARLKITALGIYEVYLDGEKLGGEYLAPGWTDYRHRIYYNTHALSLTEGEHVLSAVVADGWYAGYISNVGPGQYGDGVCLWAELTLGDGSVHQTNPEDWRVGVGGYLAADLLNGEFYDAAYEPIGWKTVGFDDSTWEKAMYAWGVMPGTRFLPRSHPPISENRTLSVKTETRDKSGNYIYDMGQNMVGSLRIRYQAEKGNALRLRYGEMLEDGALYTRNLRSAKQTDTFVPGEDGEATYMPRFTFHGFRYVESNQPLTSIEGVVMYSACHETGCIETSSALVNQIFKNQLWGQRGNFLDIPTDCPQRDERMGWSGDAQIFARTGMYNMRADAFYRKYMTDLRDAMLPNGAVTNVVPQVYKRPGCALTHAGMAGWGDAVFIIPYHHWKLYGNTSILTDNYAAMQQYFCFLQARAEGFLQPEWGNGDWLNTDAVTSSALIGTAYFAYDARLLSEMAEALGKQEDALFYRVAYSAIRRAFIETYYDADGRIAEDTQCAYTLALYFGLYDDKERTAKHLVRTIEERNNHLSTGFIGTAYLLPVLSEIGRDDLAYTLLLNETFPSWGYSIAQGATTMWERWNSYTKEDGFGDEGMNSFNHYSFGAVAQWMYEYMTGLTPLEPGFTRFAVCPHMDARVPQVKTTYKSISGEIRIAYDVNAGKFDIVVPEGTTALVTLEGRTTTLSAGEHSLAFVPV